MDMKDYNPDEYVTAIVSSASVPGIFPFTKLRDMYLIDGGTAWNVNIVGAIEKCR
jgi:predicted acylesterase/phospholipase RssA